MNPSMPKKLTPSNSASSLLLNNANLAWSAPSGAGVLVEPQPPIELVKSNVSSNRSTPVSSNFEHIALSRPSSSRSSPGLNISSIDSGLKAGLDAQFQTISLDGNSATNRQLLIPDEQDHDDSFDINYYQSQLSLNSSQTSSDINLSSSNLNVTSSTTGVSSFYSSNSTLQTTISSVSSTPSANVSPNVFQPAAISSPPQSQTHAQTLPEPPKIVPGNVSFRRQGPLRLYDPSHGLSVQSGASTSPQSTPPTQHVQQQINNYNQPAIPSPYSQPTQQFESPLIPTLPIDTSNTTLFYPELPTPETQSDSPYVNQQYNQLNAQSDYNNLNDNQSNASYLSDSSFNSNLQAQGNTTAWNQSHSQSMGQSNSYSNVPATIADQYIPVSPHWFYETIVEQREVWIPFSMLDSANLEDLWRKIYYGETDIRIVATDGNRYDVDVCERVRRSIYWEEAPTLVRRCTWFFKLEGHTRFEPYAEDFAAKLEDLYRETLIYNKWNQRLAFPDSPQEIIMMHNPNSIFHYQADHSMPDEWGSMVENPIRPRVVQRGLTHEFAIEPGEQTQVDHVVFLVHGIGEFCDLRFRSIVEVVDDFRSIALSLTRSHFKEHVESGHVGRIELLPVSWHAALHGDETGIDDRLKLITLNSIPKLRSFSNDTILDALFYASPLYCQTIVNTVGSEINRLFDLFTKRNPYFNGSVAIGGHSLGSLIVFDILAHQGEANQASSGSNIEVPNEHEESQDNQVKDIETCCKLLSIDEYLPLFQKEKIDLETLLMLTEEEFKTLSLPFGVRRKLVNFIAKRKSPESYSMSSNDSSESRRSSVASVSYTVGTTGTGAPNINYPQLSFHPSCLFLYGSPISMFQVVRGIETIGKDYRLPTCPSVFNIFHPYDPIAYRIEPLIDASFQNIKPILIPHHKGRKRMHLEIRDSISRMGSEFKQKIVDSLKYTWNSIHDFARAHRGTGEEQTQDGTELNEDEVNRVVDEEMQRRESEYDRESLMMEAQTIGSLNGGRRIDYVLQEKPIEMFNEYLFALTAHTVYWLSEDTMLLMLKELFSPYNIHPTLPGQMVNSNSAPKLYNPAINYQTSIVTPINDQQQHPAVSTSNQSSEYSSNTFVQPQYEQQQQQTYKETGP